MAATSLESLEEVVRKMVDARLDAQREVITQLVLEELEDAALVRAMQEADTDQRVSYEEVMRTLRSRI